MKNLLSHFIFLYSIICFAQKNDFIFESKHHPNSEYLSEFEKITNFKIEKIADKETLRYFDSLGIKKIQKGNKKEAYSILTKTKEQEENQNIKIAILAYNFKYNGTLNKEKVNKIFEIKSIQAIGHVNSKNKLIINELFVDDKRSEKQSKFIEKIESREILIEFPEHKIGIGDTIEFEYAMYLNHLTIEGDNLYTTNCKAILVKVKKDIAYFKISSDKNSEKGSYDLIVNGTLKFDVNRNYANYMLLESRLNINEVLDGGLTFKHSYHEKNKITTELKSPSW